VNTGTHPAGALPADCLEFLSLDGVFRNAEVNRASPYDVPGINAEARRAFGEKLAHIQASSEGGAARILPVLAPAGAGKTHLLSDFCLKTVAAGGLFMPVDLTDLSRFWPESCRTLTEALLRDGRDGFPASVSLAHALLSLADFSSIPSDPERLASWLAEQDTERLRKTLRNMVPKLARAIPSPAPHQGDAVRCLFALASTDSEMLPAAFSWLATGSADDERGAAALGLQSRAPGPEAAFFAMNSLVAGTGCFTVVTYDQLDRIISHSDGGGRQAKAEGLARHLARVQSRSRRTLCVVTSLGDVWNHVSEAVSRLRMGIFDVRTVLGPLIDPAVMEQMIAARMKDAFDEAPGFVPPYPSYPFPRPFFEQYLGKFARDVLKGAREHVERCRKAGSVSEWRPDVMVITKGPSGLEGSSGASQGQGTDQGTRPPAPAPPAPKPSPPGPDAGPGPRPDTAPDGTGTGPEHQGFEPEIARVYGAALAKFRGKVPMDAADAAAWQRPLDALAACYAAETGPGSSLPADLRPVFAPRLTTAKKLQSLTYTTLERREGRLRARKLVLSIIPHTNALAFQNRLKHIMLEADSSPRPVWSWRVVILRATPLPSGKTTKNLFDLFVKNGGVSADFRPDAGALMLALAEVQDKFPRTWKAWASSVMPVTKSGVLAADFAWLMASCVPET
jgi:hypothetical protein